MIGLEVLQKESGVTSWLCESEAALFTPVALYYGMGAQKSVLYSSSALVETSKETVCIFPSAATYSAETETEQEGDI